MDKIGPKHPLRWYLREWREHFGLTQDQVANRMDTNKGQVSKLETGAQRNNDRWILGYAEALGIDPSDLLRDPAKPTLDDILRKATPDQRRMAISLIETLLKAS